MCVVPKASRLHAAGWTILRYGPGDVYNRPDHMIAEVGQALGLCRNDC